MKRMMMLLLLCACLLVCSCALAEERTVEAGPLVAVIPARNASAQVRSTLIDGENWLFLPAFADLAELALFVDGEEAAWENAQEEDGVWTGDVTRGGQTLFEMHVMRSENLRALFLFSADPVHQGREWVDSAVKHENVTTGSMAIVDVDGTVDLADQLRQLRGRGNGTWKSEKKPYQFKLENRADLLKTGDSAERSRTWVLLADQMDLSYLHNRITMDLARETGISTASRCEHVDLYYDGEYRGLYLLSEKVEVDEGRLDVGSYDALIEAWNESLGRFDLEMLETGSAQNCFGNEFTYIEGLVDHEDPGAGTFFLEMESEGNTLSDRCWLRMSDGSMLASKNPENASEKMMRYVSERLEEAMQTLENGGVNPENGRTIHDDFDVEAFAHVLALGEMSYNLDSYTHSSSWFILPAGESRFQPGPPWDYDLSLRYYRDGSNQNGMGVKGTGSWNRRFYSCPEFMEAMKAVFSEKIYPAIREILLGEKTGTYLKPLDVYAAEIEQAWHMNRKIWDPWDYYLYYYGETFEEEVEMLRSFLDERSAWLYQELQRTRADADAVTLFASAEYLRLDRGFAVTAAPWSHVTVQETSCEQLSEATEEDYAVWQLEAIVAPDEGYAFGEPEVMFNGTQIPYELREDGTLRIAFTFEDPSYRPVDYYGEDIGMIYNPDVYAANYPDIAAEYEDDPEGLMNYFCDEGMYEDQMGNAVFKPSEILRFNPELEEMLGTDWATYYWDFLYYGFGDGWLERAGRGFMITVLEDAL